MSKRISQLDININGISNISNLEKAIAKMNDEIKELEIGSEAYEKLKKKMLNAKDAQKALNAEMEGVTSTEAAEGALKLGEGVAGAAIAVQGLTTAFGGQNEELDKTIAKVGGLILVLDGFRRVTEAASAENIKKLKGLGRAFKRLGAQMTAAFAKNPVVLVIAAIVAVGVAVIALIRNFSRLGAIIKNTFNGSRREIRKNIKELTKLKEAQDGVTDATSAEATARRELVEYTEEYTKAALAEFDAQKERTTQIQLEFELNKATLAQLAMKIEGMRETRKQYRKITDEMTTLEAKQKSLDVEWDVAIKKIAALEGIYENIAEIVANDETIINQANLLKLLGGQEFTTKQIYDINLKNLELEKQGIKLRIDSQGNYNKTQRLRLDAIEAEKQALRGIEAIRVRELKIQIELLDRGRDYEAAQREIGIQTERNAIVVENLKTEYQSILNTNEAMAAAQEREADRRAYILEQIKEANPFDKEGLRIIQERFGYETAEVQLLTELQGISADISKLSFETKLSFFERVDAMNKMFSAQQTLLAGEKQSVENNIAALKAQQDLQAIIVENAGIRSIEVRAERDIFQANLDKAKTLEEQLKWKTKVLQLDDEIIGLEDQQLDATNEIASLNNSIADEKITIGAIDADSLALLEEKRVAEEQITYELEQQNRLSARAKTFLDEYNEEIKAGQELIAQGFELWATLADRQAEMAKRDNDKALEQLEKISDKYKENADEQEDLEELLKDANGTRYDEIKARIAEIKVENASLGEQEAKLNQDAMKAQYEMEVAEWKAEKRRKAAAIIDATINAALSFVQALPNVVLAAIVAGLGIASIATIATQPVSAKPEKPEGATFAEGGYTGAGSTNEVAGVVHKSEYVVPKSIVESSTGAAMIGTLEAMRLGFKGYADGGLVTAPSQGNVNMSQDFGLLAEMIAESFRRNPPVVSVVQITDQQNRVKAIASNASL